MAFKNDKKKKKGLQGIENQVFDLLMRQDFKITHSSVMIN